MSDGRYPQSAYEARVYARVYENCKRQSTWSEHDWDDLLGW
jgi:hypothetical protein